MTNIAEEEYPTIDWKVVLLTVVIFGLAMLSIWEWNKIDRLHKQLKQQAADINALSSWSDEIRKCAENVGRANGIPNPMADSMADSQSRQSQPRELHQGDSLGPGESGYFSGDLNSEMDYANTGAAHDPSSHDAYHHQGGAIYIDSQPYPLSHDPKEQAAIGDAIAISELRKVVKQRGLQFKIWCALTEEGKFMGEVRHEGEEYTAQYIEDGARDRWMSEHFRSTQGEVAADLLKLITKQPNEKAEHRPSAKQHKGKYCPPAL